VSQTVADRLWPGQDPIGRRIRMVTSDAYWWTVVGVTGDTRYRHLREPTPTIYLHWRQLQILPGIWTVAVRTEQDVASVHPVMRRVVRDFDPRLHVWRAGTLSDHLTRGPLAQPRLSALLLSGFGLAALLLAAIGLYGVMALSLRERTHELGVRKALGASETRLRWDVLRDALAMTLAGTAAGVGAALLMSRLLVTLLFEISPADPVTLLGVCVVLLTVAVLAAYLPAQRATRIDPMRALRTD
jgi:predicted lysophospholipase L1 biosynthesis ABC-type transport system permease subunit